MDQYGLKVEGLISRQSQQMRQSKLGASLVQPKRGLASIDCVHSGGFSHQHPNSSLGSGKYGRKDRNTIDLHQTCINKAVPLW